jgi:hypothetical protein
MSDRPRPDDRAAERVIELPPPADAELAAPDTAGNLESLVADELRDGETDDPTEAAEEGLAWVPPVDPPIIVNERGEAEVAAGFGTTADDEPFDADHHSRPVPALDEVAERVLEALRAHAGTSSLADELEIEAEGGRVTIRGMVDDLADEEAIVAVAEDVDGVGSVVSRLQIRTLVESRAGAAEPSTGGTGR